MHELCLFFQQLQYFRNLCTNVSNVFLNLLLDKSLTLVLEKYDLLQRFHYFIIT
jgi:hypothetical protein